jgi:DNA-directed RNA polymerase subunit RPC12/RpoP
MNSKIHNGNVDFRCLHCGYHVSANPILSGVANRNHCPYCLWSRHLDLLAAGDRLSACKSLMRPLGLTLKRSPKKYRRPVSGELMLVHVCIDCGKAALNRIAADDDVETLLETFERSLGLDHRTRSSLVDSGVRLLALSDGELVRAGLLGWASPVERWSEALRLGWGN